MTQRGELFGEGPQACPFIALELDRDRRSDKPDYRHRCFAEPTPQPRAIAHQEQYCLSPNFAQCPIFQGWAMRAAARPVPVPQGYEGRARSSDPSTALPGAAATSMPRASGQPPLPADMPPVAPAPGEAWPSDTFAPPADQDAPSQISAFEVVSATVPAGGPGFAPSEPSFAPSAAAADADAAEPESTSAWSSSSAASTIGRGADDAPVPGFLAGRPERPAPTIRPRASAAQSSASEPLASPASGSKPDAAYRGEKVSREDLVPSWELTDKYGADVTDRRAGRDPDEMGSGGGDRFGGIVTAVAVIAILALGVLGVIFLPGLLAGHGGATPTATPSQIAVVPTGSGLATFAPIATDTPLPTVVPTDTPTPAPSPTPRTYKVKSGDQLGQIAHRFDVSVADIMAANPQITNPDDIFVGEVLVIPQPAPTEVPSASP